MRQGHRRRPRWRSPDACPSGHSWAREGCPVAGTQQEEATESGRPSRTGAEGREDHAPGRRASAGGRAAHLHGPGPRAKATHWVAYNPSRLQAGGPRLGVNRAPGRRAFPPPSRILWVDGDSSLCSACSYVTPLSATVPRRPSSLHLLHVQMSLSLPGHQPWI